MSTIVPVAGTTATTAGTDDSRVAGQVATVASGPGIDPTGATDSTAGLAAFFSTVTTGTRYRNVQLHPGTYRIDGGLTIDTARIGLSCPLGGVTLNAANLAFGGTALTLISSATNPSQTAPQAQLRIGGFQLTGPGKASTSTGINFDQTSGSGNIVVLCEGLAVNQFGTGHLYGSNAFTINHLNSHVGDCTIAVSAPAGATNGGERLTYMGCTIYNSGTGVSIYNGNGEIMMVGCSLDYNDTQLDINDGRAHLSSCHIEKSIAQASRWIKVTGNSGQLTMHGGSINATGALGGSSPDYIVQNDSPDGPGVFLRGVWLWNLTTTTGEFASGTGYTHIESTRGASSDGHFYSVGNAMNLLADGGAEQATVVDDWFISADSAAVTNPLTGANIAITTSTDTSRTGGRAIKLAKTNSSGLATASLSIPLPRGAAPKVRLWYSKPGAETGTVFIRLYWAVIRRNTAGIPVALFRTNMSSLVTLTLTSAAVPWTTMVNTSGWARRAPAWATHLQLEVNLNNFVGPGAFYLDDLSITAT